MCFDFHIAVDYNLELDKAITRIKETNSKLVCIQLADGLKPEAKKIQQAIQKETDAKVLIWMGSCYGGCDYPIQVKNLGADLLIQWGHSEWKW